MPVKFKLGDIIISNSPSKRKVLKVFSNSYVLSKPNQLDVQDTKMLYTDDYIEWKGWHKEEAKERVITLPLDYFRLIEFKIELPPCTYCGHTVKKEDPNAF